MYLVTLYIENVLLQNVFHLAVQDKLKEKAR